MSGPAPEERTCPGPHLRGEFAGCRGIGLADENLDAVPLWVDENGFPRAAEADRASRVWAWQHHGLGRDGMQATLEFLFLTHVMTAEDPASARVQAARATADRERERARQAAYELATQQIEHADEVARFDRRLRAAEREKRRLLLLLEGRGPAAPPVSPEPAASAPRSSPRSARPRLSPAARAIMSRELPDPAAYDVEREEAGE